MKRYYILLLAFWAACSDTPAGPPIEDPAVPTHDLIFEGYMTTISEMLVLDSASGEIRRLLPPGTIASDPEPSPDGSRIAFVVVDPVQMIGDIFVVNRDGSGLKQITFDPELDDQPSWSPDGQRIAFRSYRAMREGDIWVMNADGSNATNLTPDPLPGVTDERRPAWSPDGSRIAYSSNEGGDFDIWTMNANGGDRRRLTNSMDFDAEPAWSPDGMAIAFRRSTAGAGSDIALVPATGGAVQRLTLAGEQRLPVWSPDGKRIVFVNQVSFTSRPDIYSMRSDASDLRPIVTDKVPNGSIAPNFLRLR